MSGPPVGKQALERPLPPVRGRRPFGCRPRETACHQRRPAASRGAPGCAWRTGERGIAGAQHERLSRAAPTKRTTQPKEAFVGLASHRVGRASSTRTGFSSVCVPTPPELEDQCERGHPRAAAGSVPFACRPCELDGAFSASLAEVHILGVQQLREPGEAPQRIAVVAGRENEARVDGGSWPISKLAPRSAARGPVADAARRCFARAREELPAVVTDVPSPVHRARSATCSGAAQRWRLSPNRSEGQIQKTFGTPEAVRNAKPWSSCPRASPAADPPVASRQSPALPAGRKVSTPRQENGASCKYIGTRR